MKTNVFNNLLLFSLFGIALGFFGILYEGIVYGPKMMNLYPDAMVFWREFFSTINPLLYYTPWVGLATLTLVVLYFSTLKQKTVLKKRLGWASVFQIVSLALTFYIVTQINLKQSFGNIEVYGNAIKGKIILFNVLSIIRIVFVAIALSFIFKGYIQTQKEQN